MSRKRLFFAALVATFALFLGTTDAEARSRYGRRSNQQNGCRQSSNYGRMDYGRGKYGYSNSGHNYFGNSNSRYGRDGY